MALKHVLLVIAVSGLVLGVPVVLATGAFTSATLDREAEVKVASDSEGLLALIDGHPGQDIIYEQDEGTITIDLTTSRANGINREGTFYIGSTDNAVNNHAFAIENRGTQTVDIELQYTLADSNGDPDPQAQNIIFKFYDQSGNQIGTMSEETGATTVSSVASGESIYVVIQLETDNASPGSDLSGDLQVSAVV